jgi:aldehyde:ferredoxin oxidoreductase
VDLTRRTIRSEPLEERVARCYIGGSGLGARILFEETDTDTLPLGPENVVILATGPVTGTKMYSSDRFAGVTLSPLTGIFAESTAGGHWGSSLKKSGYDAVVLRGRADRRVYLLIDQEKAEILDAGELWGLDTFATTDLLRARHGHEACAAVVGPAGEKLVPIANVVTDGAHGRVLGRCGLGAVLGSKNLKAVVVHGRGEIPVAYPERLRELLRRHGPAMRENTAVLKEGGTSVGLDFCEQIGNLPLRNWYQGTWPEGAARLTGMTMAKTELVDRYRCGGCVIGCGRVVEARGGPYDGRRIAGPEYETLALLGANCLVDDLRSVIKANELCNRYGIDTISTGAAVSFAIEATERGLLTAADAGGVELRWGLGAGVLALVEQIGQAEGLGGLLGQGVRRAARELGGNAEEFAVEVKGLEAPGHDPRARFTQGLGYATSSRGACHLSAFSMDFEEGGTIDDLGAPPLPDRFNTQDKGENIFRMQNLMSMFDSLVCCKFVLFGGITVQPLIDFLNCITGWDVDHAELSTTGDRLFNLKRLYNARLGISRKDDRLPPRLLTHRRGGGTNELPLLNVMLSDYYRARGWDELGLPTAAKLEELGLDELVGGPRHG